MRILKAALLFTGVGLVLIGLAPVDAEWLPWRLGHVWQVGWHAFDIGTWLVPGLAIALGLLLVFAGVMLEHWLQRQR